MLTLLERLREKPKHVRVQAAFVIAVSVTGLIALAWGLTLPYRLEGLVSINSPSVQAVEDDDEPGFFASAGENLAQLIGATESDSPDEPATEEVSASGAYRTGAPEDAEPYGAYELNRQPAAEPISAREVRIATTTR